MSARWQQIRAHATAVRARYAAETGMPVPPELPVEDLAEQLYLLSAFEDPTLDRSINGELNPAIGSIRLRPGLQPHRRRFVVAHELGHYVLEGASAALVEDDDTTIDERAGGELENEAGVLRAYNTRERHEQEANLFALEVLIPADMLWQAIQHPGWTIEGLAETFDVSVDAMATQIANVCCLEPVVAPDAAGVSARRAFEPNAEQQAAVDAPLPTLVVAGPGTGKTRSIVAKYLSLVAAGVDPAAILALTFSNEAAEEMRERIIAELGRVCPDQAGRVDISTFHAWGLDFLKSYGHHLGLPLDAQLRAPGDIFILLKRRLADLPLVEYKLLHDPAYYLSNLMQAISRAKDELCTPAEYRRLAEATAERLLAEAEEAQVGKTTKKAQQAREKAVRDAARLREMAGVYERYEMLLREERVLDYGDLIMRSVEALRIPEVAAQAHARYQYILVDEFQDINYASGELVRLLDGGRGRVWAVGDPWQSIYRFRGASPANLQKFEEVYPAATIATLSRNYRSVQPVLDASHAIMAPDPAAGTRPPQQAWHAGSVGRRTVLEWVATDSAAECAAIAHDILQRAGGRARRSIPCAAPRRSHTLRRVAPVVHHLRRRRWRFADHAVLCRKHSHAARIVAALEAHGVPVEWVGDIYQYPEVKDTLAICAMVRSANSAGMLRALTIPEHALDPEDFDTLVRLAHAQKRSLPRATRDATIVTQLSPAGQATLQALRATLDALAGEHDAWRVLVRYLFSFSAHMRARLRRAAGGDPAARRELAILGQLILAARNFVRQAPPRERDAAAFITYIRLLIEAGETTKMEPLPGQPDAVRVMTVHAAKGLEFPIVYVPCLQEGQFPPGPRGSPIPALPAMVHGSLGDELQEERYLLYVAITRAQHRLVISRAVTQGERAIKRSSLLPGGADGATAPWPIVSVPDAPCCPSPAAHAVRLTTAPITRMPVPASSLDTYEKCPRRYLYQYGYQLYDDVSPYLRMHQAIRDAVAELTLLARDGALPPDRQALDDLLWRIFARRELEDVLYARDYFQEAMGHVRQVWNDLRAGAITAADVDHTFVVQRPTGAIAVHVDRVEQAPAGPRWIRVKSGRADSDDHLDTRIMLYTLAYNQAYGSPGHPAITLHYTATGDTRSASPRPDVLERHTEKIDALLAGIVAGRWQPKPGQQCATCPFNLICPV